MLKPKSQTFKLKFHLAKVQAVNNKVNSKVHAYLHIDNQQLQFKGAPELKKNVAIFGSDLEYDNFMINFDEITGLYEQKKVLLVIEFQTQGAYIKIGQVNVNVGEILNDKKYRVVNVYPLSKCYDKSAKVKLAVDFIPVSDKRQSREQGMGGREQGMIGGNKMMNQMNQVSFKQSTMVRKEELVGSNAGSGVGNVSGGFYKNPTGMIKSRLAQQQNVILQERIYQYQKRMDNYRIAQNQLSQRMQEQLQRKDQKISELSLQLTKQQNTIHLITLENQSFKTEIRQLKQQTELQSLEIKSHIQTIEQLQRQLTAKDKELQAKMVSLQNLARTKQNKEKHLSQEIQKYTSRYSQSQQERNKIIFELENKLKLQLEKKDQHYQELLKSNQAKYLQSLKHIKERNKHLQNQHKHIQELSQSQDSKLKALTLQLQKAITLTQQQQQQMVYLNQQLNKGKKLHQTLTHELDSLNFSYQQTVNELQTQKDHNKQLLKKLQLLKTELSLSNQTIDQQRQRIIVMNKDLQVHEEREYYMKEHYEEDIYDREVLENNLRTAKDELQGQLKRVREQLKLSQDKIEEEHNKNHLLKSTLDNVEKQLVLKNSQLIKLGEEKIYLQTQCKNSRQLIQQLQHQIQQIQQQKTYLSQAFMEKKIALQNDKSLQWTYKIQSLQNDIQLMVDKFKQQKQSLKQTHRKQDVKKVEEINKLSTVNKKLLQDIQDIKDKLSKRQHYLLTVEKSLKSEKQKSLDYQRQLMTLKQTYRLIINQKQTLEHNVKQISRTKQSKQKQLQQLQKRSQKYKKDLGQIKNGFNRLISVILQYMVRRYNERVNFQDVSLDLLVDGEIVAYVNVALKKFCQDHNRTRDMIKELEEFKRNSILTNGETNKHNQGVKRLQQQTNEHYQGEDYQQRYYNNTRKSTTYQYQQQHMYNNNKRYHQQRPSNYNNSMTNSLQLQSPFNIDPAKQLQSFKSQVDRLRKEQAQNKVKVKGLQEQIQKQQRYVENAKFQLNRTKGQLQQAHDQITRVNFVLRKKDKIIKQLESQLQQVQKQLHDLKLNPHHNSNTYQKAKQKLTHSQHPTQNPSLPIIRDLQSKLNLKSQELLHVQKQLQSLRQQYIQQLNQVKKLQAKLKEKANKIASLQKQVDTLQMKRTDDKDKEIMRLKKMMEKQVQQREKIQQKVGQLDNIVKQYEQEISHLSVRNKQLQDQIKMTEIQFRRNLQSNQYLLNDKSTLYETQILQLKSQLSQQHQKSSELSLKYSQLNLAYAKKSQELQHIKEKLNLKEKELLRVEQLSDQDKNKMTLKINGLNDRIRELENMVEAKSFQLQECKFAYEGRVLQLQRQMDQFRDGLVTKNGPGSAR